MKIIDLDTGDAFDALIARAVKIASSPDATPADRAMLNMALAMKEDLDARKQYINELQAESAKLNAERPRLYNWKRGLIASLIGGALIGGVCGYVGSTVLGPLMGCLVVLVITARVFFKTRRS